MDTSVLNTIPELVRDHILQEMNIEIVDETAIGQVKIGKLQSSPETNITNLTIHPGGEGFRHELATSNPGLQSPTYFMGDGVFGGAYWWRRFEVKISFFFKGESERDVARAKAHVMLSRLEHTLYTTPLTAVPDDFGEAPIKLEVKDSYIDEGGGPGEFIWRGFVRFQVLTERGLNA